MKRQMTLLALLAITIGGVQFTMAGQGIVLRGVIERLDGPIFVMKTRYNAPSKFILSPSPHVIAAERLSIEGIKPGAIVRVVRRPGTNSIAELHVFSEMSQRLAQDILDPGETVGVERDLTSSSDGYRISINGSAGEEQILVPGQTSVIAYVPGEVGELKAGAAVIAADGKKMPDGLVEIDLIVYGRDGAVPKL